MDTPINFKTIISKILKKKKNWRRNTLNYTFVKLSISLLSNVF